MHEILRLILNSALLWIFLQAIWDILESVLYEFCIPWILWGSFIITIGIRIVRVPPPDPNIVRQVIGIDPLSLNKDNGVSESQGNGEQFCMRVVAHRGGGYDYPENSLSAFRNSKDKGCSAVEFDVSLTKDNIPILFHDETIERLTGKSGFVKEMTWDQLKELDITYNHPLRNKFTNGERIATFYETVEECMQNEMRIIIDIKEKKMDIVQIILDAFNKYPKLYQRAVISSFNPTVIYMIRRRDPRIVASLAWRPNFFSRESYIGLEVLGPARYSNPFKHVATCWLDSLYEWLLSRFVYYVVGNSIVMLHKDIVNPRVIGQWHSRGIRVMAWGVNLPTEKQHFSRLLKITYLTDTLLADKLL